MRVLRVEDVAQILGQHVKTVRRHIREGRLPAAKVGGEWRVREEDLGAFLDGRRGSFAERLAGRVADFTAGGAAGDGPGLPEACVIVRYDAGDAERAAALGRLFLEAMNADLPTRGRARFEAVQDPAAGWGRYVLWGRPAFLADVLLRVDALGRDGGATTPA